MKLTGVLLMVGLLNVYAEGNAQHINFSGRNVSLDSVLLSVEKQTDFVFLYSANLMKSSKPVTIDVRNATLEKFLTEVFKSQPLEYVIEGKSIFIYPKAIKKVTEAPVSLKDTLLIVRGRIVDEKSEPVMASIIVKGTQNGGTTDAQGFFELKGVDDQATLVITGINIKTQELKLNGSNELLVRVQIEISEIEAVAVTVNTGYQQFSKRHATGSVAVVDNKTINMQVGPYLLDRLNGMVSGVAFDNNPNRPPVTIRGLSTIWGSTSPLIIVDNFPYEGNIQNINPNDIESITILKDAAAGAIWGARAGNGVIVITTKKGKLNQRVTLEVNANTMITAKPDVFYLQPMKTSDLIDAQLFLYDQGFYESQFQNVMRSSFSPLAELLKTKTPAEAAAQISEWRQQDIRNDFDRYVYQRGNNQQYSIGVHGGGENASYSLFGGIDQATSTLAADYRRANLRLEHVFKPLKNLQVTTYAAYTHAKSVSGKPEFSAIQLGSGAVLPAYAKLADEQGNPLPVNRYVQSYIDTAGQGRLLPWEYYPLEEWKQDVTIWTTRDLLASLRLKYDFSAALNAEISYQYETQQEISERESNQQSFYARDLINQFTQIDPVTGVVTNIIPKGGILNTMRFDLEVHNVRAQINYSKTWKQHSLQAIAGNDIREQKRFTETITRYGYDPDIKTFAPVDQVNFYPNFIHGYSGLIPGQAGMRETNQRFVSLYSNVVYTYQQRYSLSASARRDGSNLFGVRTNQKWAPLWSVGAAWTLSEEPFYKLQSVPYLKLRLSYGSQGNVSSAFSAMTTILYLSGANYTNYQRAIIAQYENPELKWETVRSLNVGTDFSAFNNRISGSVDVYRKVGIDLYGNAPIDYTAGVGSYRITKNVASSRSTGADVQLTSKNIDNHFKWQTTGVLTLNRSVITDFYLNSVNASNFVYEGSTISGVPGKAVYGLFSYAWAGLDPQTGEARGFYDKAISKDYSAIVNDSLQNLVYHGSAVPTVTGSLINTFSYKGFQLSVSIIFKAGYYFRKQSIDYNMLAQAGRGHSDYSRRWQAPGDEQNTYVPAWSYNNNSYYREFFYSNSAILAGKGDHIRLQFINLGYTIPHPWAQRIKMKNAELYCNLANLGILWRANKDGIDPDYSNTNYMIPLSATTTIGARINF